MCLALKLGPVLQAAPHCTYTHITDRSINFTFTAAGKLGIRNKSNTLTRPMAYLL